MASRDRTLLGMLTPSSNTVLEPITTAILAPLPHVSAHFSRFRVTEISLTPLALGQFDDAPILQAAELLADAQVDVIAWNGTSASWLGFERDVTLCDRITTATGIPATTSLLALLALCKSRHLDQIGLVTPYLTAVQERIVANFAEAGIECVSERHLNLSRNFEFAEVSVDTLTALIQSVAASHPKAVMTLCTNLRAAPLAAVLEPALGLPLLDSTAAAVWQSLCWAEVDPQTVQGWGRLFTEAGVPVSERLPRPSPAMS